MTNTKRSDVKLKIEIVCHWMLKHNMFLYPLVSFNFIDFLSLFLTDMLSLYCSHLAWSHHDLHIPAYGGCFSSSFFSFYLYSVCYSQNCLQALCRNPDSDPPTSNGGKEKLPLPGTNYEQDQAHMDWGPAADGIIKGLIVYICLFLPKVHLEVTRKSCSLLRLILWTLQVIADFQIKLYNNWKYLQDSNYHDLRRPYQSSLSSLCLLCFWFLPA